MSVPKFSNPHDSLKATKRCTRAQVFGGDGGISEDDANGGAEARVQGERLHRDKDKQEGDGDRDRDAVKWLDEYLRASLVYAPLSLEEEEVGRPRKRRRKLRTGDEEKREGETNAGPGLSTSVFEFRLLSGGKNKDDKPRQINVLPKPSQIQSIEREYEDTPSRASLRTKQAREVAVDFDWVIRQSSIPIPSFRNQVGTRVNDKKKHKELVITPNSNNGTATSTPTLLDTSNLVVVELPKPHSARPRRRARWEPSPHELKKAPLCCPLIAFSSSSLPGRSSSINAEEENILGNTRRRRRRAKRSGIRKGKGETTK